MMQDAFAYCAELVRSADRDRYLASLFAPAGHRGALHALYAFNIEIARVRDVAHQALAGEIRLQWWREAIGGERPGEIPANPVAAALMRTIERHGLSGEALASLIEARRFDVYDEPMASLADLESYAKSTCSALFALTSQILGGIGGEIAAGPAGIAYAVHDALRLFPLHAARRQLYVPAELLRSHGVDAEDVFAGRGSGGLDAALADLRQLAQAHLDALAARIPALPPAALPAFLPAALVRPSLKRLDRRDPFQPQELSPLRKQWLLWRAAGNPGRIAG